MPTPKKITPFIIVADLRTGSTLLASSLNRHPQIRCYGEILHEDDFPDNRVDALPDRRAASGAEVIEKALDVRDLRAVGFKAMVFLPPPSLPQWADAWPCLQEMPELRVVYLTRGDRLAQYTSLVVAGETGVFHPYDNDELYDPSNRPTVHIAPEAFRAWVSERDEIMRTRRRQLHGKASLEVDFETLTTDWDATMSRVQHFLGVDAVRLAQNKKKQETRPLSEVIANYDELGQTLRAL